MTTSTHNMSGTFGYTKLSRQHEPTGAALDAEIQRHHAAGLTARDIGHAMRIDISTAYTALVRRP